MRKIFTVFTTLFLCVSLVSCSQSPSNQDIGTVSGAVIGGLAGSRFGGGSGQLLAIGAGTLAGALIGGAIGRNMDQNDQARVNAALESNAAGRPAYWSNPNSGNSYTVTPVKNVSYDGNPYCREYRTTAIIAGKRQQMYGTACRQPDGSWKMISEDNG